MFKEVILKLKLTFIPCKKNKYRPRFWESNLLLYCIVGLLVLKLIAVPFLAYFPKTAFFADVTRIALVKLTNQERESLGLQPLRENPKLNEAAYLKAEDMMEKDYFSHESPEGISPWHWFKQVGYNYRFAGENLAVGFLNSEEVHGAWLDSPSHKNNLLSPNYNEIGVAVLKGEFQGDETTIVVQLLGISQVAASQPESEDLSSFGEIPKNEAEEVQSAKPFVVEETENLPLQPAKVLSASPTEAGDIKEDLSFNFFKFIFLEYSDLIQNVLYNALLLIVILLLVNVFVGFDVQHKDLILRAFVLVILLSAFVYFDEDLIIKLIPHDFYIY